MKADGRNGGPGEHAPTALIADDDAGVRQQLRAAFAGRFQVLEARNGRDALKILAALPAPPAIAVLDIVMPVVGGLEVMSRLRQLDPKPPVVALVCEGPASADLLDAASRLGAAERLVKPVAAATIARLADKLLA
jgi:CheY-like chemotaxis protein